MFTILNTRDAIERTHKNFVATIEALSTKTVSVTIGYQGGVHKNCDAKLLSSLGVWAHLGYPKSNLSRYWDVFGIGKPTDRANIVCEINSPLEGINRKIAGAFGEDHEGRLGIFHRGKLHAPGLDSRFFRTHYRGEWMTVNDGDRETDVILIAMINSADFGTHLKEFVFEVNRIKALAHSKA